MTLASLSLSATLSFDTELTVESVHPEGLLRIDPATGDGVPVNESTSGYELPCALVRCLTNGVEPLLSTEGRPFDALTFVFYGLTTDEHDLWTCSCGVAGCAGLHDGVRITVLEDQVHWTFPLTTYQNKFSAAFREAHQLSGPVLEVELENSQEELTLVFARTQYEEALQGLKAHLIALRNQHPILQLAPSTFYDDPKESALSSIWESCESRARENTLARELHLQVFGDMADLWLDLYTPLGAFQISPYGWRAAICPDADWNDSSDGVAQAYREAALLMHSTQGTPLAFMQSLSWKEVCRQASPVEYTSDTLDSLPEDADDAFKAAVQAIWRN